MTIETKFNIGDKVWFIYGRSVSYGTIKEVSACHRIRNEFGYTGTEIDYRIETGYISECIEEKYLFRTKQELLDSL